MRRRSRGQALAEFALVAPIFFLLLFGIIEGGEPGPCVLVTAGVHGSEYCSIETAVRQHRRRLKAAGIKFW